MLGYHPYKKLSFQLKDYFKITAAVKQVKLNTLAEKAASRQQHFMMTHPC